MTVDPDGRIIEPNGVVQKPPLGIRPEKYWLEGRILQLEAAIERALPGQDVSQWKEERERHFQRWEELCSSDHVKQWHELDQVEVSRMDELWADGPPSVRDHVELMLEEAAEALKRRESQGEKR